MSRLQNLQLLHKQGYEFLPLFLFQMKNINLYKIQQPSWRLSTKKIVLHKENFAALILRMLKQQRLQCEHSCASRVSSVKMINKIQSSKAAFSTDGYPELRSHRISVCVKPDTRVTCLWKGRKFSLWKPNIPNCSRVILGRY